MIFYIQRFAISTALGLSGLSTISFADCIRHWSEVHLLQGQVKGIDLPKVKKKGSISFKLHDSSQEFSLSNFDNYIYAKTPEGSAAVSLCLEGGKLKAVARIPFAGKKEAQIESIGQGEFRIRTNSETYRARVNR